MKFTDIFRVADSIYQKYIIENHKSKIMDKFLKSHKTDDKFKITHTCLINGKYSISLSEYAEFEKLYIETLARGRPMHLSERVTHEAAFNFFLDIDFNEIVELPNNFTTTVADLSKKTIEEYLVVEKVVPITSCRFPYKIHINFPNVPVSYDQANSIQYLIIQEVNAKFPEKDYNEFFDKSVYNSGLRMMGSSKHPDKDNQEMQKLKISYKKHKSQYSVKGKATTQKLLKKVRLRTDQPALKVRKELPVVETARSKKKKVSKKVHVKKETGEINENGDIELAKQLLNCLPENYAIDYTLWRSIGFALKSGGIPLQVFEEWSDVEEYEGLTDVRQKLWDSYDSKKAKGITFGTLRFYAKKEDLAKYSNINQEYAFSSVVDKWNARACVISKLGKTMIIDEGVQWNKSNFLAHHTNQTFTIESKSGKSRQYHEVKVWFDSKKRKEFNTIVFKPLKETPNDYNLWKGYSVESEEGDITPFLDHIKNILCSTEEEYEYIIRWFATVIQFPYLKTGVALVLRSEKEGAGKGVIVQKLQEIFSSHFFQASDPKQVLGQFNSHLHDKCILFLDELVWGGNKEAAGALKKLITEANTSFECKGLPTVNGSNCWNVIMASNEDWIVPAKESRRYFALEVKNDRVGDREYFNKIRAVKASYILHYFQNIDLTGFDVADVPKTELLKDQALMTMSPLEKWVEKLRENDFRIPGVFEVGEEGHITKNSVFESYKRSSKDQHLNPAIFWKKFKSLIENETIVKYTEDRKTECNVTYRCILWIVTIPEDNSDIVENNN